MSHLINSGLLNIVFLLVIVATPVVALIVWFFVNRASVRANEQIELLNAVLEQLQQQNALLTRLCQADDLPPAQEADAPVTLAENDPLIQLVAER